MKKYVLAIGFVIAASVSSFMACEKSTITEQEPSFRRGGNGNGRGNNSGTTTTTYASDSILDACGVLRSDTGWWYPAVQINNLTWRKQTGYSRDPNTGLYTYPYDILVINMDPVTIPGKTVNCYTLLADQCQGRVVCTKSNGLYLSQVTTCNPTGQFWLPIGTTWLNPNVQTYTGIIMVGTTDGCLYYSQPFTFEPPRILSL